MGKDVQTLINELTQEDFNEIAQKLLGDLTEDELAHWGVLGMKWGVRKDRVGIAGRPAEAAIGFNRSNMPIVRNVSDVERFKKASKRIVKTLKDPNNKIVRGKSFDKFRGKDLSKNKALMAEYEQTLGDVLKKQYDDQGIRAAKVSTLIRRGAYASAIIGITVRMVFVAGLLHEEPSIYADIYFEFDQEQGVIDVREETVEHGDLTEDELAHWGVLGMKWGVRKDRGGGKVGTPAAGTPRAKHNTPSVSPGSASGSIAKPTQDNVRKIRKTASPDGETSIPDKGGKRIKVALDQKQKSKLGSEGLKLEDYSVEQLRKTAERFKLEAEITNMLAGETKDQAMQAVVNRIKLEQEYKKLTALPPTKKQIIFAKAKKMLGEVAEAQTKAVLNAVVSKGVGDFLISQGIKPAPKEKEDKPKDTPKAEKSVGFKMPDKDKKK